MFIWLRCLSVVQYLEESDQIVDFYTSGGGDVLGTPTMCALKHNGPLSHLIECTERGVSYISDTTISSWVSAFKVLSLIVRFQGCVHIR